MSDTELDIRFKEAVEAASKMTQSSLPQDVQLRLYAYYKQATMGTVGRPRTSINDLRNAFKLNAWMQISHLSVDEAKALYVEAINKILKGNK
ncbi:MAG: acyl-CoA-binding protein [Flavobacterium sp.]